MSVQVTQHDECERCPECGRVAVGYEGRYEIDHVAGCSVPPAVAMGMSAPVPSERWVVVVSRTDVVGGDISTDVAVLGPFRRRERADARAATIGRLAAKYDEPPGTLHVIVEPLRGGSLRAQEAMDRLYGGLA